MEQKISRTDPKTGKIRPEYFSWHNMIGRVNLTEGILKKKENKVYADKKLDIHESWRSFETFYNDMGPKPTPQHSLDRVDNSRGYYPDNCRWASPTEQIRNRACSKNITYNGETKTWTEWAKKLNTTYEAVRGRVRLGWTPEQIITIPYKRKSFHSNKKVYTSEIKNSVINKIKDGFSQKEIKKETNLSEVAISKIIKEAREKGELPPFKGFPTNNS